MKIEIKGNGTPIGTFVSIDGQQVGLISKLIYTIDAKTKRDKILLELIKSKIKPLEGELNVINGRYGIDMKIEGQLDIDTNIIYIEGNYFKRRIASMKKLIEKAKVVIKKVIVFIKKNWSKIVSIIAIVKSMFKKG